MSPRTSTATRISVSSAQAWIISQYKQSRFGFLTRFHIYRYRLLCRAECFTCARLPLDHLYCLCAALVAYRCGLCKTWASDAFSLCGALLSSALFIAVNIITTPHNIWAVYPIFAFIWWPLATYYFIFRKFL